MAGVSAMLSDMLYYYAIIIIEERCHYYADMRHISRGRAPEVARKLQLLLLNHSLTLLLLLTLLL